MKAKALIARLSELDPEEDIFILAIEELGPTEIRQVAQEHHYVMSAGGKQLPKMVWCVEP